MKILHLDGGGFQLDGGALFGVVPKSMWCSFFTETASDNIINAGIHPVAAVLKDRLVLVDAGSAESTEHIVKDLRSYGYSPDDVTDIIFTHLHTDHCGGAFVKGTGSSVKPVFPYANYYCTHRELENALQPDERTRYFYDTHVASFLSRTGNVICVDRCEEVLDGVEIEPAPGHTPGHAVVWIRGSHQVLVPGDMIATSFHLKLHYMTAFDQNVEDNLKSKKAVLEKALRRQTEVYFYHCEKKTSGYLTKNKKEYTLKE